MHENPSALSRHGSSSVSNHSLVTLENLATPIVPWSAWLSRWIVMTSGRFLGPISAMEKKHSEFRRLKQRRLLGDHGADHHFGARVGAVDAVIDVFFADLAGGAGDTGLH